MGKVRKLRQKYHLSLKKSESLNNLSEIREENNEFKTKSNLFMTSKNNIFDGINISWDDLNKSLPADFDVRSVLSTKSRKELKEEEKHWKKKEKKKLRHERFMAKLCVAQQLLKNAKTKAKKPNKAKFGDLSSLKDALPSLESFELNSRNSRQEKPKGKLRGIQKAKIRLKQQSNDTKIFRKILDDEEFRKDPFQAIFSSNYTFSKPLQAST